MSSTCAYCKLLCLSAVAERSRPCKLWLITRTISVFLFFWVPSMTPLPLTVGSTVLPAMTALWHHKLHAEIQFLTSAKETCNNSRKLFGYTQGHTQTKKTHYWRCRGEWQLWVADETQSNYAPVFDVALLGEMQNCKSEFGQRSLSKF